MKYLIVIPARGGSKGISLKNIYPINGKPLLEYTLDVSLSANLKDTDIVVSTDSERIKAIARRYKDVFIVNRPTEISGDKASTEAALIHALNYMEKSLNMSLCRPCRNQRNPEFGMRRFYHKSQRLFPFDK